MEKTLPLGFQCAVILAEGAGKAILLPGVKNRLEIVLINQPRNEGAAFRIGQLTSVKGRQVCDVDGNGGIKNGIGKTKVPVVQRREMRIQLGVKGLGTVELSAGSGIGLAEGDVKPGRFVAVGISGIAGPAGGSELKPVGTVCFGYYLDGLAVGETVRFGDLGRDGVRNAAVEHALSHILDMLKKYPEAE